MYFDKFDICEAYQVFATLYHGGQWSKEYAIHGRLARIGYRGHNVDRPEELEENARAIFDALVARHGFEPYDTEAAE
jgi:hypothetical protein